MIGFVETKMRKLRVMGDRCGLIECVACKCCFRVSEKINSKTMQNELWQMLCWKRHWARSCCWVSSSSIHALKVKTFTNGPNITPNILELNRQLYARTRNDTKISCSNSSKLLLRLLKLLLKLLNNSTNLVYIFHSQDQLFKLKWIGDKQFIRQRDKLY